MRKDRELFTAVVGVAGALISLLAFMFTLTEINGVFSSNQLYMVAIFASGMTAIFSIYILRVKERLLRKQRIFVIYSHKDAEIAQTLVNDLKASGFDPWFDRDEILPGQRIDNTLLAGISQSAVAILLVSKNINPQSKYLSTEIEMALSVMRSKSDLHSPIIPVLLDDSPIPQPLEGVNWIRLESKGDFERLVKGLHLALDAQQGAPEGRSAGKPAGRP